MGDLYFGTLTPVPWWTAAVIYGAAHLYFPSTGTHLLPVLDNQATRLQIQHFVPEFSRCLTEFSESTCYQQERCTKVRRYWWFFSTCSLLACSAQSWSLQEAGRACPLLASLSVCSTSRLFIPRLLSTGLQNSLSLAVDSYRLFSFLVIDFD